MEDREIEQYLREEAKTLLEKAKVDYIVGFEPGSLKFTTTPLITRNKNDVSRLIINPFMANNLGVYLTDLKGRVGIVAKGCDSRSIISLIQDNQVKRVNVIILGVPCSGVINLVKMEKLVNKDRDKLDDITRNGDKVIVTIGTEKMEFPANEALYDKCLGCEFPVPPEYDILLGKPSALATDEAASRKKITTLEEIPQEQRWHFWEEEFGRCIRCYACRNICPACFCERCFVEESEPQWIAPIPRWQENLIFQVIRNIHIPGRCTDCGECERACPVNIPLRSLTREMYDLVANLYHFKAGTDKEVAPLMAHYESNDPEDFIR